MGEERAAPSGRWERLGAASGLAFAVVFFVGISIASTGDIDPDSPARAIAAELADARDRLNIGAYIALVGLFFFLWFVAYLRSALARAEGPDGWLATAALAGGLAATAALLVQLSYSLAGGVLDDYGADVPVARTLIVLSWGHLATTLPGLAALTGATAVVALRTGLFPRWVGWVAAADALVLLSPLGFLGFVVFFPWVVVVSILLWAQARGLPLGTARGRS